MIAPIIAGAAIAGGASLLSSYLSSRNKVEQPPPPPDYSWVSKHGPAIWNYLRGQGYDLSQNPYGLGDARGAMERTARNTSSAGYSTAQRNIARNTAMAGLSPTGGQSTRQQYVAGREYGESLNRALSQIDIADFQAKEDQRQRGLNLLFSLTNKSPVYSQIVSQNYWNALNAQNAGNMATYDSLGQAAGGIYGAYQMNQWMNQNPYGGGSGAYQSPYGNYYQDQFNYWQQGNQGPVPG